jgi:hypothetical protein
VVKGEGESELNELNRASINFLLTSEKYTRDDHEQKQDLNELVHHFEKTSIKSNTERKSEKSLTKTRTSTKPSKRCKDDRLYNNNTYKTSKNPIFHTQRQRACTAPLPTCTYFSPTPSSTYIHKDPISLRTRARTGHSQLPPSTFTDLSPTCHVCQEYTCDSLACGHRVCHACHNRIRNSIDCFNLCPICKFRL